MTKIRFSMVCALGLLCVTLVHAQDNNGTEFTPAPTAPFPELQQPTEDAVPARDLITISLDDVELIDVVRMFSRIAAANIIANPELLSARVTVNLDNVEWRPALSSILSMHGLALVERPQGSGVFTIVEPPPDAPPPMSTETIFLNYTTVEDVRAVVDSMRSGGSSLTVFPSRNALVLRDTEDNLTDIRSIIETIDILARQVVVETQFIELDDSAASELGIRWDSLASYGLTFQAGPFSTTRSSERVTSRTDARERTAADYRFDGTDMRFNQFGERVESGDSFTYPDGFPVGQSASGDPSTLSRRAADRSQISTSEAVDGLTRTVAQSSAAVLTMSDFNLVMSALKSSDGVSIVSNPKIIVTSGSTNAFFSVGNREPIFRTRIERGTADAPGNVTTSELDTSINTDFISGGYLSTGIDLHVVPTVKTDDLIEASITPSLRRFVRDKQAPDGSTFPEISVKEIRTHFTLTSGQTVAIGGLTDSRDVKRTSKIPLLGDIPIIGRYLFSHTRDTKDQSETIIFVTLSLADPTSMGREEGIPQRSHLVHQREIRDRMRRLEIQQELEELQRAAKQLEEQFERRQRNNEQTVDPAEQTVDPAEQP